MIDPSLLRRRVDETLEGAGRVLGPIVAAQLEITLGPDWFARLNRELAGDARPTIGHPDQVCVDRRVALKLIRHRFGYVAGAFGDARARQAAGALLAIAGRYAHEGPRPGDDRDAIRATRRIFTMLRDPPPRETWPVEDGAGDAAPKPTPWPRRPPVTANGLARRAPRSDARMGTIIVTAVLWMAVGVPLVALLTAATVVAPEPVLPSERVREKLAAAALLDRAVSLSSAGAVERSTIVVRVGRRHDTACGWVPADALTERPVRVCAVVDTARGAGDADAPPPADDYRAVAGYTLRGRHDRRDRRIACTGELAARYCEPGRL